MLYLRWLVTICIFHNLYTHQILLDLFCVLQNKIFH
nr:MAG TPA: hypothetical protein [Caudoviricetes sp.]